MRAHLLPLATLGLLLASACQQTRFAPEPMPIRGEETPPPGETTFDAPEVTVVRHADPVRIRRPGAVAEYPLAFWRKRDRIGPGGAVVCGAGGKAEILWPGSVTSVVVAEETVAEIGDPTLDEPAITFRSLSFARLQLGPELRVCLPGGAELWGEPGEQSGPFLIDERHEGLLRLTNASKYGAEIHFRDAVLEVGPGEVVDLPQLADSAPIPIDPATVLRREGGIDLSLVGQVEPVPPATDGAVHLRAVGSVSLAALGVRIALSTGDEAVVSDLRRPATGSEAAEASAPDPEAP